MGSQLGWPVVTRLLPWLLLSVVLAMSPAAGQVPEGRTAQLAEAERLTREIPTLYRTGRYTEALADAQRALAIREQLLGPEHLDTATSLNHLGVILFSMGRPQEARPLLERSLAVRRKLLAPGDPDIAETLTNLGAVWLDLGDVKNARSCLEEAVGIFSHAFGRAHPAALHAMTQLGMALKAGGDLQGAKALQEEALPLAEILQADAETYAVLNNLGGLSLDLGDLGQAQTYFERAVRHCETKFGPEHPWTALSLNNLGGALREAGDLHGAKLYFERSLAIRETIFHGDHPEVANGLINVGGVLLNLGNAEGARQAFEKALGILERLYGPGHPAIVPSLTNLAQAHLGLHDLGGAAALLEKALAIQDQLPEPETMATSVVLASLGATLMEKGELARAQGYFQRALRIREASHGESHPATASILNSLGVLRLIQGDRKVARPLLERALIILTDKLGPQHPDTLWSLRNMAGALELDGETDRAIEVEEAALEGEERSLLSLLSMGSEADKALALSVLNGSVHSAVSLHARAAPDNPRALRLAFTTVLRRKGRILDATVEGLRYARGSQDPRSQQQLEILRSRREQWAFLLLRPPPGVSPEERRRRLQELAEGIHTVAAELAERNPAYRQEDSAVNVDTVQPLLGRGTALVELFQYRPWRPITAGNRTWWDEPRYVAYVLHHDGPPRWADLGLAAPIERAVEDFRRSLAEVRPDVLQRGRALDALTMAKVRPLVGDAEDLILSPDGSLQLVPFAALVDEEGRYLIERYSLRYVTSGRDLLRFESKAASQEPGLLLGDVDFEAMPGPRSRNGEAQRSADLSSLRFGRLPGTGEEVRAIGALLQLPAQRVLTGPAATERAVKDLHGPEILHVASHGFFLPDAAAEGAGPIFAELQPPRPLQEDPLLRSGLALSGFNRRLQSAGPDDGVLTALEVADLDLCGTQLVVLSACGTGLGDVRSGQGVFGLRRALALAGAQAQAMSLWQVADEATRDLMIAWYRLMLAGVSKAEALRRIQLAALAGQPLPQTGQRLRGTQRRELPAVERLAGARHPYYWAGWILAGDPRPLKLRAVL
jgi:CHAT domain-containing protein/tetratricopeptide (TPR) repeat protein